MRATPNPLVEPHRKHDAGPLSSDPGFGNNGVFLLPFSRTVTLQIIVSDGMGWDHVSVVPIHARNCGKLYRTPTWEEMAYVKGQFFGDDETAIEYHPPKRLYRNAHEYCLHLWRPQGVELPLPDPLMVAPPREVTP